MEAGHDPAQVEIRDAVDRAELTVSPSHLQGSGSSAKTPLELTHSLQLSLPEGHIQVMATAAGAENSQ